MTSVQRVILILIDGLRPDAIEQTDTPALHRLMLSGAYTLSARSVSPEITLPCHVSLFHSITPQEHGVQGNTWQPLEKEAPGLVEVIRRAGKNAAFVYSWEQLRDLARPGSLAFSYYHRHEDPQKDGRELELAAVASDILVREEPVFTFLYIEVVDLIGHLFGWMSPEYLDAVTRADRAVELLLDELTSAGLLESTAILVAADHGGHEHWHGPFGVGDGLHPEDGIVPLIISAPGTRKGAVLESEISLLDIAPTIVHLLNLPQPEEWQGRALLEALEAA